MRRRLVGRCLLLAAMPLGMELTDSPARHAQQLAVANMKAKIVDYQGSATFSAKAIDNRCLRIDVDPGSERQPLKLGVEPPSSAQTTWATDVEVVDAKGRPLLVRRSGIEWHRLLIPVPAQLGTYLVRTVEPRGGGPHEFPDKDREAIEPTAGLKAEVRRWCEGREAALSIRFDDSDPTHLSKAIPILREYGFRGTLMVYPRSRE